MKLPRRQFLHLATGVLCLPAVTRFAMAQTYPSRPVRIIVAAAAGGFTDITARLIGQWLTKQLGQSFFVENRPGGNNNIGTEAVVRAPATRYFSPIQSMRSTPLCMTGSVTISSAMSRRSRTFPTPPR